MKSILENEPIAEFISGNYMIYVFKNSCGGLTYISDEIGCGLIVWDTSLINKQTLLDCINFNDGLESEGLDG